MQTVADERRTLRKRFYVAVAVSLGILFVGWWAGSMVHLASFSDRMLALGRLFGLLASWNVVLEIMLMSRIPFIEYMFDLQDINDLHRLNGYALLVTMSAHLAFLLVAYADPLHVTLWAQFLAFLGPQYEDVLWATLGTVIFIVAGGLSVKAIRVKLRYEWWYLTHLTIYFGIALTFLHQIKLGGDFIASFWFAAYWYALYILTFVLWLWYRFLRPFWVFSIHRFTVQSVEKTARDIYSVTITGRQMRDFHYKAGQYATWRFLTPRLWYEGHPFSFSSSPGSDTVRITLKASADFVERIKELKPGDPVLIDGPRGNFTADRIETPRAVLVAGGIGITPFLSTIRHLLNQGKSVSLLYAVRTVKDIAFRDELERLEAMGLHINCFIDERNQRITNEVVQAIAAPDATVYICGPDGMSRALVKQFKKHGIPNERIITERFAY